MAKFLWGLFFVLLGAQLIVFANDLYVSYVPSVLIIIFGAILMIYDFWHSVWGKKDK